MRGPEELEEAPLAPLFSELFRVLPDAHTSEPPPGLDAPPGLGLQRVGLVLQSCEKGAPNLGKGRVDPFQCLA